jgi:AcrR family transcriptional regulator
MRTVGSSREATWPAIRRAGIDLLYRHGFEAMNLRELAAEAGLKGAGSLYNYFGSKEDFLFRIMCEIMDEILVELEANVGPVKGPVDQLMAFVEFHIRWHTGRREETFISHMEMRSLSAERYRHYVGLRKRYEAFVMKILVAGCKSGDFSVVDPHVLTQSILSMLTAICNWYHVGGRVSQKRLIEMHQQMVLAMLQSGDAKAK